ncbi:hypothetical protein MMC16_004633 [Acarospora aff. strigata]|nr:hypothetical protein [Acarospora aff. strigata]
MNVTEVILSAFRHFSNLEETIKQDLRKAPKDGASPEKLLALADVTTTAWHGCELAVVGKADVVEGARKVYAADPDPQRLKIAESFGCIGVDVSKHPNASEYILQYEPHRLNKGIEASGLPKRAKLATCHHENLRRGR